MTALDQAGRSELHYAALEGRAEEVRELIQAGADVTAADSQGMTALHFDAQQHEVEAARALVDAQAPVNAVDDHGNTPLFWAVFASQGRGELIALLLSAGADPDIVNQHGTSARELAEHIGSFDVKQFFADVSQ